MNLKEINEARPSAWVAVISLVIVVICTAAILWPLGLLQQRRGMSEGHKKEV